MLERQKDKVREAYKTLQSAAGQDPEMSDLLYAFMKRFNSVLTDGGVPPQEERKEMDPADAALNDLAKEINALNGKYDQRELFKLKQKVWEFKKTYPGVIAQGADRARMQGYAMNAAYFSPDWKFCIRIIKSGGGAPYIIDGVDGDEVF